MNNKSRRITAALEDAHHTGIHVQWSYRANAWVFHSDQAPTFADGCWNVLGSNVNAALRAVKTRYTLIPITIPAGTGKGAA